MARAERLTGSAGAAQSESWIAAQEALTAAIGARKPIAKALGDIDALGADRLQTQGGLAPNDLAACKVRARRSVRSTGGRRNGSTPSSGDWGFSAAPRRARPASRRRPPQRRRLG